ncbi:hypothetical protein SAMN05444287_1262 [Octadecabacter temperatus]|uniref:Uncharacterized protein n=1 Tax=Octadecabacter temperatus TaxID=1458307 RepID=A0A0K0Y5D2_9RHOB|nr:hypothetical protein OSB_16050 [Octadecabacter temperatus]SIO08584.1 hypothetical protein SAMN05444287_1262 [Octadecabacter temperatus]
MDYSQIIAAQMLSHNAGKRQVQTEEDFYARQSIPIFGSLTNWVRPFLEGLNLAKLTKVGANCRLAVQKLC